MEKMEKAERAKRRVEEEMAQLHEENRRLLVACAAAEHLIQTAILDVGYTSSPHEQARRTLGLLRDAIALASEKE